MSVVVKKFFKTTGMRKDIDFGESEFYNKVGIIDFNRKISSVFEFSLIDS